MKFLLKLVNNINNMLVTSADCPAAFSAYNTYAQNIEFTDVNVNNCFLDIFWLVYVYYNL